MYNRILQYNIMFSTLMYLLCSQLLRSSQLVIIYVFSMLAKFAMLFAGKYIADDCCSVMFICLDGLGSIVTDFSLTFPAILPGMCTESISK